MINKHKSNKIKENSYTVRHLNNGTDHRHSKSCCDQSSPARRTMICRRWPQQNVGNIVNNTLALLGWSIWPFSRWNDFNILYDRIRYSHMHTDRQNHYNDVTWSSRRLNSRKYRLFLEKLVQADTKKSSTLQTLFERNLMMTGEFPTKAQ